MTASEYIRQLYPDPEERMANVLIPRAEADGGERPKVEQRVWPARTAMSAGVQAWMRHLNARRYDVFVGMNPLRPQARRRFKRDVQAVARVYLDVDEDGPGAVRRVLRDARRGRIGMPRFAIETSPGRSQIVWQLQRGALRPERAEALMRGLVAEYGGDRAAVDVSRVLRLPGFRNWKRGGHPVAVTWQNPSAVAEPGQFPERLYKSPDLPPRTSPAGTAARRPPVSAASAARDVSKSGRDWHWARKALRGGADPDAVALQLERERPDKANPRYYARRTVRNARASLARGGGCPGGR
ncbi:MAG: DNA-primase RepB domain-containing protein [Bryobacterales bacterium]|nr:DNA-primase RepB domain-containing protein [Bryobacterales bacterium]